MKSELRNQVSYISWSMRDSQRAQSIHASQRTLTWKLHVTARLSEKHHLTEHACFTEGTEHACFTEGTEHTCFMENSDMEAAHDTRWIWCQRVDPGPRTKLAAPKAVIHDIKAP